MTKSKPTCVYCGSENIYYVDVLREHYCFECFVFTGKEEEQDRALEIEFKKKPNQVRQFNKRRRGK